ncbi:hypothetical protein DH2020_036720 [Rehmannia glutinosa]|uniref:Uncharacterized protein n=1 Tax=Rehmannia glutinosa TaxID=99300 RepID=A0ABR0V669_REHGL
MPSGKLPLMEISLAGEIENKRYAETILDDFWPLPPVDPKKATFPCCLVWTPLPVVSWLAPFIGHVGICKEDGTILDFSGSNLVNVDDFAFGSVARYLQFDREQDLLRQCCFPPNIAGHKCKHRYAHTEFGTAITWDDAMQSSARYFEHKSYNLFTCNCHSFVANCLNRLCYEGSMNLEHGQRRGSRAVQGDMGRQVFSLTIIFTVYGGDLFGYLYGWMAIFNWIIFIFVPHCWLVFVGYLLF